MRRLLFRDVSVPVIIGSMRSKRVVAVVAALATLVACSPGREKGAKSTLPVNPKPTAPGQVVIIAGDYRNNGDPIEGMYAVQANASSPGGLAVGSDGSTYFPTRVLNRGRIARVGTDGRLRILPFDTNAKQIAVQGDFIWLMSSYTDGFSLTRASLSNKGQTLYVGWNSQAGDNLVVVSSSGKEVAKKKQQVLELHWPNSVLGLRADGVPVIASSRGELFEALGGGKLRSWEPPGYMKAVGQIGKTQAFQPLTVTSGIDGGMVVLGRFGLIRIPKSGSVQAVHFPKEVADLPSWQSATPLADGSILLLGGVSSTQDNPRPTRILGDGSMQSLKWGASEKCSDFDGKLASIASAEPGGVVRRPDGSLVMSDQRCDRIYAFRLPV